MKHNLSIMDRSGDRQIQWDDADPVAVAQVRAEMEKLLKDGHALARTEGRDNHGVKLHTVDDALAANDVIAIKQIVAG